MIIYFCDETREKGSERTIAGGFARRVWDAVPRVGDDVSIHVNSEIFTGRVTSVIWGEFEQTRESGFQSTPFANVTLDPSMVRG